MLNTLCEVNVHLRHPQLRTTYTKGFTSAYQLLASAAKNADFQFQPEPELLFPTNEESSVQGLAEQLIAVYGRSERINEKSELLGIQSKVIDADSLIYELQTDNQALCSQGLRWACRVVH